MPLPDVGGRGEGIKNRCYQTITNFVILQNVFFELSCLRAPDQFGYGQWQTFSLGVSKHINKIKNLRKIGLNWSSKLQENKERRKKKTIVAQICVLLDAFFSKTMLLQRELFLTMFYSFNSSPLLFTFLCHKINLSNYQ